MWNCVDLALTSILLWLYLQTIWVLFINFLYFTIPWLIWGAVFIYLVIKFGARVPPPDPSAVKNLLGIDPSTLTTHVIDDFDITKELDINRFADKEDDQQFCMRVIAHRGAGYDYPENSMSAFRNSQEKGCDGIEFDLALTKDNIPIIFHDITIDRLTGFNGTINEMTWDELKDYDISANHPLRVQLSPEGEKIVLFEEVLEETLEKAQRLFIDIKATGNEIVKIVLDAYKKYPTMYKKAVITSFNPAVIYMIRRKDPRIVGGLAWRPKFFSTLNYNGLQGPHEPRFDNLFKHIFALLVDAVHDWAMQHLTYYILGLSFVLLHKDVINHEVVRHWKQKGIRVLAWTVNLPSEKVHFRKNLKVTYLTDTLLS